MPALRDVLNYSAHSQTVFKHCLVSSFGDLKKSLIFGSIILYLVCVHRKGLSRNSDHNSHF